MMSFDDGFDLSARVDPNPLLGSSHTIVGCGLFLQHISHPVPLTHASRLVSHAEVEAIGFAPHRFLLQYCSRTNGCLSEAYPSFREQPNPRLVQRSATTDLTLSSQTQLTLLSPTTTPTDLANSCKPPTLRGLQALISLHSSQT